MKFLLFLSLFFTQSLAFALVAETTELTCNEARGFVSRNRVINMTSHAGPYPRYVSAQDGSDCFGDEVTERAVVPTLDEGQCMVGYICMEPTAALAGADAPTFMPH